MLPSACESTPSAPRLRLIHFQAHRLGEFVPVEVDIAGRGIGLEDLADLFRHLPHLLWIVAQHAEHDKGS